MKFGERWEIAKKMLTVAWNRMVADIRAESKQIEFKKARKSPGPLARTLLWGLIVCNAITVAFLATTIVFIPLAVLLAIATIYIYQVYLRGGE
jgi:hypothetical protein